jgi:CRISPR/Cas system CSM-associated protein Csm3 (group 7 of RAMP superfamily)
MTNYSLKITLLSDTTFGRGEGLAGVVDAEVQHDALGVPYLGGRALKGMLGAECADILVALQHGRPEQNERWHAAEQRLFGRSGSALRGQAILRCGPARMPDDLRAGLAADMEAGLWTRDDILNMLTTVRRQTAMDARSGAPKENTLRTLRVVLRETVLEAALRFEEEPADDDLALLAAGVKALRRAGTGRNRGKGKLKAELRADGQDVTAEHFAAFRKAVAP